MTDRIEALTHQPTERTGHDLLPIQNESRRLPHPATAGWKLAPDVSGRRPRPVSNRPARAGRPCRRAHLLAIMRRPLAIRLAGRTFRMGTCSRPVRRNVFNDAIGHEGSVGHIESDPNNGSVRAIEADADDIATGVGHAANLDALKAWGKHSSHLPFRFVCRLASAEFYDLLAGQWTPVG